MTKPSPTSAHETLEDTEMRLNHREETRWFITAPDVASAAQ
jgi:hypothetical protein